MNFIAHYYLDCEHPSAYFQLGTFFPDLLRFTHPGIKAHRIEKHGAEQSIHIFEGIQKHLAMDKVFHQSRYFQEKTKHLRDLLVEKGFQSKGIRVSFIAHIVTEILFDRILLLDKSTLGSAFYSSLNTIDHAPIHALLQHQEAYQADAFATHFDRFRTNRWLLSYVETEHVFYALNRICERLGTPGFKPNDYEAFAASFHEAEESSKPTLLSFLEQLHSISLS
jgi:acyl carrier protein phosphodiesterase